MDKNYIYLFTVLNIILPHVSLVTYHIVNLEAIISIKSKWNVISYLFFVLISGVDIFLLCQANESEVDKSIKQPILIIICL